MIQRRETNASVVVVGRLNPFIFQSSWLRDHKIIGQNEADAAEDRPNQLTHSEITQLNFSSLRLQVEHNRFVVTCVEEPLIRAKDFAVSCFRLLSHTPVGMIGLNKNFVLRVTDENQFHSFGDKLAPKAVWSSLLDETTGVDRNGGLRSITMERSKRRDGRPGYVRVRIDALETGHMDVNISVNSHLILLTNGKETTGRDASRLIDEGWTSAMNDADTVLENVEEIFDVA